MPSSLKSFFLGFALVLLFCCSSRDFTPPPGGEALPGVESLPRGTAQFQLAFATISQQQGGQILSAPPGVVTLRFRLALAGQPDIINPVEVAFLPISQQQPPAVTVPLVPLNTPLRLRVEALDASGKRLFDLERQFLLQSDGETVRLTLTQVEGVLSGLFYLVPHVPVTPEASTFLASRSAQLAESGAVLAGGNVIYEPSPCANWRMEVGGETFRLGPDGQFLIRASELSVPTGRLRHPTDPNLSAQVDLSSLSPGQISDKIYLLQLPFSGPCGMDLATLGDDFCGAPLSLESLTRNKVQAQGVVEILPSPSRLKNKCGRLVPNPTQSELRARGRYARPTRFFTDASFLFPPFGSLCEQTNGFVDLLTPVPVASRGAEIDYIGSTCHQFVSIGGCPNENAFSDTANLPAALLEGTVENIGSLFFDGEIELLAPALIPGDNTSCVDNHLGRFCQEVLIGDVSLDFPEHGGVRDPMSQEMTIEVVAGEEVSFVLHNNGCFGETVVSATESEAGGTLERTFREYAISPRQGDNNSPTPTLQTCTDPLLDNAPTSGRNEALARPANLDVTPLQAGFFGLGSRPSTIVHAEIDGSVAKGEGNHERYRYFPDVALLYKASSAAALGSEDRFVFSVDNCEVAITFKIVSPLAEVEPGVLSFRHDSDDACPFPVGVVTVRNEGEVTLRFGTTELDSISVVPNEGFFEPGQEVELDVTFDCSRSESFDGQFEVFFSSLGEEVARRTVRVEGTIVDLNAMLVYSGPYSAAQQRPRQIGCDEIDVEFSGTMTVEISPTTLGSDFFLAQGTMTNVPSEDFMPTTQTVDILFMACCAEENQYLASFRIPRQQSGNFAMASQPAILSDDGRIISGDFVDPFQLPMAEDAGSFRLELQP